MNQDELNRNVDRLLARFDEINSFFIERVALQIAEIGELSAASINTISIMASMYEDIADINRRIAKASKVTVSELHKLYNKALNDVYYDSRFERALKETPLPESSKRSLEKFAQAVSKQTVDTMENLSNTTVIDQTYRKAVDKAIIAVSSGVVDYQSMMRKTLRELASTGLQVEYESGYHRRLDSALRMNILDGVKQIQQNASDQISDELGFDAKEISVHANSAPDHEPVQGHVFLLKEFEKLQSDQDSTDIDGHQFPAMRRAIYMWNCYHFAFGFSTKYSKRKYTDEQLEEFKRENAKGCVIGGKHYTKYEATQLMRKIETEVRRQKDIGIAADAAGDKQLFTEARQKVDALVRRYAKVAEAAGLPQHRERMNVEVPRGRNKRIAV